VPKTYEFNKINEVMYSFSTGKARLMFQDEAGFGRINRPKYCWCYPGLRPVVPCHHIREYRYAYGAVEPQTGESFFLVLPYCNTTCMNVYLARLSTAYPNDNILLVTDGASWHKASGLQILDNISLFFLPQATPEMNPIEQTTRQQGKARTNRAFLTHECVCGGINPCAACRRGCRQSPRRPG
jgi:putative transposase